MPWSDKARPRELIRRFQYVTPAATISKLNLARQALVPCRVVLTIGCQLRPMSESLNRSSDYYCDVGILGALQWFHCNLMRALIRPFDLTWSFTSLIEPPERDRTSHLLNKTNQLDLVFSQNFTVTSLCLNSFLHSVYGIKPPQLHA